MLLPSLTKARKATKRAVCASLLSQNQTAYSLFLKNNEYKYFNANHLPQSYAGTKGYSSGSRNAGVRAVNLYLYGKNLTNADEAPANICPEENGQKLYDVVGNSYAQNSAQAIGNSLAYGNAIYQYQIQDPTRMVFLFEWGGGHYMGNPNNQWSFPIHGQPGEYVFGFVDGHINAKLAVKGGLRVSKEYTCKNGQ